MFSCQLTWESNFEVEKHKLRGIVPNNFCLRSCTIQLSLPPFPTSHPLDFHLKINFFDDYDEWLISEIW